MQGGNTNLLTFGDFKKAACTKVTPGRVLHEISSIATLLFPIGPGTGLGYLSSPGWIRPTSCSGEGSYLG